MKKDNEKRKELSSKIFNTSGTDKSQFNKEVKEKEKKVEKK
jgi:hypothetical protein